MAATAKTELYVQAFVDLGNISFFTRPESSSNREASPATESLSTRRSVRCFRIDSLFVKAKYEQSRNDAEQYQVQQLTGIG